MIAYKEPAMEADDQRMRFSSRLQIFRHQDIDADGMFIDGFVAGTVDVEGRKLFRIHGCG